MRLHLQHRVRLELVVAREGDVETDHAFGHPFGRFGQAVVAIGGGAGELINSASQADDQPLPFQAGNGGGGDAGATDFGQSRNAVPLEVSRQVLALGAGADVPGEPA